MIWIGVMSDKNWLPSKFIDEMKEMLGDEFDDFLASYDEDYYRGIRCNTLKITPSEFEKKVPFVSEKVDWVQNGYYTSEDEQPAKHPYYFAGLYYIQEPSAMMPASQLPVEPGDRVLDLCAAPGGKTTELGAKLKGEGVLVSNDISASRAKALVKNVELFGIKNAMVVSESPDKLAERLEGYFDKILVDAPCSGEGMFRKVHSIAKNWEQYGSQYYADIQRTVLPSAVKMLKPGGMMIYSTCTFSKLEDEDSISFILENNPDMELIESHKLFPHKIKGEGHFVALLHKKDTATALAVESSAKDGKEKGTINKYDTKVRSKYKKISDEAFDFFESIGFKIDVSRLWVNEDRINMLPEDAPDLSRLRVLRTGLFLGEMKKGRFEPSQSLALALKAEEYPNVLDLKLDDDRVVRYLKCESIDVEDGEVSDGYCLVAVDGYPLGWGKVDKGRFKNKYLPSWRLQ
jgi:NOL1/NOP2/sun family putative RNA methylase